MPEAFKENLNHLAIAQLAKELQRHYKEFQAQEFEQYATDNLSALELKQRSRLITEALHHFLPANMQESLTIISNSLAQSASENIQWQSKATGLCGWIVMPICDFAAEKTVGTDFETGMAFQAHLTTRFSAEFSIRQFIMQDQDKALATMLEWTRHENPHIRRLASEGCRPRLPWGVRLQTLVADPEPILAIIDALIDDDSEYVRRSVANNLNDISKDHPDLVVELVKRYWQHNNANRTRLLKHASRTLIKSGHNGILNALGVSPFRGQIKSLSLDQTEIAIGESVQISLVLDSTIATKSQRCILDYVVYYRKKNGKLQPKVFKWKVFTLTPGSKIELSKTHHFKVVTTREHYPGEHKLRIMLNGLEQGDMSLCLKKA